MGPLCLLRCFSNPLRAGALAAVECQEDAPIRGKDQLHLAFCPVEGFTVLWWWNKVCHDAEEGSNAVDRRLPRASWRLRSSDNGSPVMYSLLAWTEALSFQNGA